MEFKQEVIVRGMKRSKGEMDGVKYDSTKFYIDTDLDDRSGNAKGIATMEYSFGTSEEYTRFESVPCPFKAEAIMQLVTTGKVTKMVLAGLRPLAIPKPAQQ